ncbi:MAG: methyltetrahydrofolate cobalamin methyltransferase [Gammaproteobacteria bacterium]|nr:MAG: methyltetrahydrofolate cobalamin methyltransferase [Gammaproteobacteria bacterium]
MSGKILEIIGENFNATRRVKATSPRIVQKDGKAALVYMDLDGTKRFLDVSALYPSDPAELRKTQITHIAQAMRNKDLDYIDWVIRAQAEAGATIIDICVDEISVDPDERNEWMRWIIPVAQKITDLTLAVDSSDPNTIVAGLEVYEKSKSRPAINSVNLEDGRQQLIGLAKEHDALLFANASGRDSMPANAEERVANLQQIMAMMDEGGIAMTDRYLDPLAFPIGAGSDFSKHYLDAVQQIRAEFPEVHIFGGHSNTSFGLPKRRVINDAFITLAIISGCDTLMIDPILNPPKDFIHFKLAHEALMGRDEMCVQYMSHLR